MPVPPGFLTKKTGSYSQECATANNLSRLVVIFKSFEDFL